MLQLQPLVVRLTFPQKLSQTSPLLRPIPSPVIPLSRPVMTKLYGVLLLKIFALVPLLSQLTPSTCPLVLVSSLLLSSGTPAISTNNTHWLSVGPTVNASGKKHGIFAKKTIGVSHGYTISFVFVTATPNPPNFVIRFQSDST